MINFRLKSDRNKIQVQKRLLTIFVIIFLIICLSLIISHQFLIKQVNDRTGINTPNGISSLEKIKLGGIDQWILIRGWNRSNPVLLFLHGGPGAPLFTYARDIGVKAKLEQHFTVVYWEQRATGKSFSLSIPEESMTIEQFVSDASELIRILKDRFKVPKIFLVGRSWGSLIGLLMAKRYPELFYAYIGIGQIVDPLENDRISYRYTMEIAERSGNKEALNDLRKIGEPPFNFKELIIQRKWLTEFYKNMMAEKFNYKPQNQLKKLLATPEYSLIDILKMGQAPFFSIKHLWNEKFYKTNLFEQIPQIEIPVFFLAGRYDYFTPSEIVGNYYHKLITSKGKHIIWFEKSGHYPELEEPKKFYEIMINKVLREISD